LYWLPGALSRVGVWLNNSIVTGKGTRRAKGRRPFALAGESPALNLDGSAGSG
jgi:hypothetical protein